MQNYKIYQKNEFKKRRLINLLTILGLIIAGIFGLDFVLDHLGKIVYWEYKPLHSAIEIFGAIAAIFMALVLLQREEKENNDKLLFIILGFLGMGGLHPCWGLAFLALAD